MNNDVPHISEVFLLGVITVLLIVAGIIAVILLRTTTL